MQFLDTYVDIFEKLKHCNCFLYLGSYTIVRQKFDREIIISSLSSLGTRAEHDVHLANCTRGYDISLSFHFCFLFSFVCTFLCLSFLSKRFGLELIHRVQSRLSGSKAFEWLQGVVDKLHEKRSMRVGIDVGVEVTESESRLFCELDDSRPIKLEISVKNLEGTYRPIDDGSSPFLVFNRCVASTVRRSECDLWSSFFSFARGFRIVFESEGAPRKRLDQSRYGRHQQTICLSFTRVTVACVPCCRS